MGLEEDRRLAQHQLDLGLISSGEYNNALSYAQQRHHEREQEYERSHGSFANSPVTEILAGTFVDLLMVVFKLRWKALILWAIIGFYFYRFPHLVKGEPGVCLTYFLIMVGLLPSGPNARKLGCLGLMVPAAIVVFGYLLYFFLRAVPTPHHNPVTPAAHSSHANPTHTGHTTPRFTLLPPRPLPRGKDK